MSNEKSSDELLTTERLIALAKMAGVDLGASPQRRISYLVMLNLLPRPTRHSKGRGQGVQAVFPSTALARLRDIQALADEGVPFNKMRRKLTKSRRVATDEEAAELNRTWSEVVAGVFEDASKGEMKDVTQILSRLMDKAEAFDAALGAEDELDKAMGRLYQVSRLAWVFTSLHPEEELDEVHRFFKREMQKAFAKLMTTCGFQLGKLDGPVLRQSR